MVFICVFAKTFPYCYVIGTLILTTYTCTVPGTKGLSQVRNCDLLLTLQEVDGFTCTRSGPQLSVSWLTLTTPFPTSPLQLFANDSMGEITARNVSVVLCQCNDGNCTMDMSTLDSVPFDSNRYYQWPCACPEFFGGDSCEVDQRGCGLFDDCPSYSVCMNDTDVDIGYVCQDCLSGFEISQDGRKCVGEWAYNRL